jgi:hypothetical protein
MGATDAQEWVRAGREFSAEEIGEIRETVAWLPGLARRELAASVCEHLHWHTAAGTAKLQACQKLPERLAAAGLLDLPALRRKKNHNGNRCVVALSERTATDRPLAGPLRALEPVRLEVVTEASDEGLWNEYVERFHPLGDKGAFGYRLRYFIRSDTQRLGCVLLAGAARAIAVRDRWIGWNDRARLRNLPRVVNNVRLRKIPDLRNPRKCRHKLTVLLLYGLLMFVLQFASRREVNREMPPRGSRPICGCSFPSSKRGPTPTPCIGCYATSTSPKSSRRTSSCSLG